MAHEELGAGVEKNGAVLLLLHFGTGEAEIEDGFALDRPDLELHVVVALLVVIILMLRKCRRRHILKPEYLSRCKVRSLHRISHFDSPKALAIIRVNIL